MAESKNVLLIVGNGFDINLGLKTSYKNFIDTINIPDGSDEISLSVDSPRKFERINESPTCENRLIMELKNLHEQKRWVDIELELGNLARSNFQTLSQIKMDTKFKISIQSNEVTKDQYIELKQKLKDYLTRENNKFEERLKTEWVNYKNNRESLFNFKRGSAYETLRTLLCRDEIKLTVLNFNYTFTIPTIIDFFKKQNDVSMNVLRNVDYVKHIFVHSNINNDIIFGIDESEDIDDEYNYLLKSFDNNILNQNVNNILDENDEIVFFGYSLGKTDESYFDDFFKKQCQHNIKAKTEQKKIHIYHYGYDGYHELYSRLRHLTNKNINKLNQNNNLIFTDCCKLIDN